MVGLVVSGKLLARGHEVDSLRPHPDGGTQLNQVAGALKMNQVFNAPASRLKKLCRGAKSNFRSWSSIRCPSLAFAGGSVQGFLEGITTVQGNAFGQGAKFGTFALSPTLGLIAPVLGRPFKNFHFPVFRFSANPRASIHVN